MLGTWNSPVATMPRPVVVAALGTTQTLAWASSYYLPAIIARDIAEALAVSQAWVFGIFSASLVLSALLGPAVGRLIDRRGGAGVLIASNLLGGLVSGREARRDRNAGGGGECALIVLPQAVSGLSAIGLVHRADRHSAITPIG
jgi:MFS family permease